jgi:1,3-propanediol dehydrogenase
MGVATEDMGVTEAAQAAVTAVKQMADSLDIHKLKDTGIRPEDFDTIADVAMQNLGTPGNARKMTRESFIHVIEETYEGA